MTHTIQDQGLVCNKKRRRGEEEDGNNEDTEEAATCRTFGIILGCFRTEMEVLADFHLRYPWVQLTRNRKPRTKQRFRTHQHPKYLQPNKST